ncbi:unnamed protein product, partial [Durusdinium trenchii]
MCPEAMPGGKMEEVSPKSSHREVEDSPEAESSPELINVPFEKLPAYPFPADIQLKLDDASINVIMHKCHQHPKGTKAIVLLLPGVHGGVGPCRQPGQDFDERCLYASLAQRLHEREIPADLYRCSWPFMRPHIQNAVKGVVRALHLALFKARVAGHHRRERKVKVILIGHSLGASVALSCALYLCQQFGSDGRKCRDLDCLEHASVQVAGLCTLNGACNVQFLQDQLALVKHLGSLQALLVSGDADEVVDPVATEALFQ